jgi:hypothetical protein
MRFVTSRTSPAEIRFPAGRLEVAVADEEGRSLDGACYVGPHRFAFEDGVLDLRGVPGGTYRLIVGASEHHVDRRDVVMREGEHRRVEVVLPYRE